MRKLIACLLLVVIFAAGCSSGFDREGTIDDIVSDGVPREQATCMVDAMVDEFSEEQLMSDDDPSPEDTEILFEIMTNCLG